MTTKFAWAAALLLTTTIAAAAQTTAPSTATPPAPAMAPTTSPSTVPESMGSKPAGGSMAAPMSSSSTADLSKGDKTFISKAASAGMAEVQEAQLAQQKSQDPKVKEFAQKMITDHTSNNQQLKTLAQQKGVDVPAELASKDQKEVDKLSKLDGTSFDKAYLRGQVKGHETMLKLLQKEASSGKDADLKSFAQQTIPVVQDHLSMAKSDSMS
jgi:putative membrane protein